MTERQSRREHLAGPWLRAMCVLLLASFAIHGCASIRRDVAKPNGGITVPGADTRNPDSDRPQPVLKVHVRDGSLAVLDRWLVVEAAAATSAVDTLVGTGTHYDAARRSAKFGEIRVAAGDIVLIESNHAGTDVGKTLAGLVLGVAVVFGVIAIGFLIACAVDPKCFGSCPTFYVTDGEKLSLMAEGFSASIAPSLEATDVDALWRARPSGRQVEIVMRNEALETHVVRSLRLLAVPRGGGRVMQTTDGGFHRVSALRPPVHARADEGDVASRLASIDGVERFSSTDSTDLSAHERIVLDFGPVQGEGLGIAIAHRQSLVMTYLLYQTLAWMGGNAGTYLANAERGERGMLDMAQSAGRLLGPVEVQVREPGGAWRTIGEVDETGPIATDVHLVPLPRLAPGTEIGLWIARGHWRLDAATLVTIGEKVEPVALEPVIAVRDSLTGPSVDRGTLGGAPLVTMPGQSVIYRFELPRPAGECELFLESRGYYLEWVREQWLREENPGQLVNLLMDPRGALRRLAPAFKAQEAELERAFWGSRAAHP